MQSCDVPPISSDVLSLILIFLTWITGPYLDRYRVNLGGRREVNHDDGSFLSIEGLTVYLTLSHVIRVVYTSWLKYIHEIRPDDRVYNVRKVKKNEDPCGRTEEQLRSLEWHGIGTTLSDHFLVVGSWILNAELFWPAFASLKKWNPAVEISYAILHLYILSFFMYWAHRLYHENDFLWRNLHSVHHWAYRPQAQNTFEDHWLENTINALAGHYLAQYLLPLGPATFHMVRLLRLLESLEKHSGLIGYWNVAYTIQSILPGSQTPQHHDYHHSGNKCSNYAFSAVGGIWDVVFCTQKEPPHISAGDRKFSKGKQESLNSLGLEDEIKSDQ